MRSGHDRPECAVTITGIRNWIFRLSQRLAENLQADLLVCPLNTGDRQEVN
jgi:hypothetical protein